jgi:hypothetical protein
MGVGMMSAIQPLPNQDGTSSDPVRGGMGGLLSEINKKKPADEGGPPKPPAMGGLLAAIQKRDEGGSNPPKPPAMGGLLAEIQKKGGGEEESKPDGGQSKKKMGLLAAITGRRKK